MPQRLPDSEQQREGPIPVYSSISDFQYDEKVSLTNPQNDVLELKPPAQLFRRKLYCWLFAVNMAGGYYAKGVITFYDQLTKIGELPVGIGNATSAATFNQSIASVAVTQGIAIQDSLGLYISNPTGSQPASILLQPLYINGKTDRITFSLKEIFQVSSVRLYLACISSPNQ